MSSAKIHNESYIFMGMAVLEPRLVMEDHQTIIEKNSKKMSK